MKFFQSGARTFLSATVGSMNLKLPSTRDAGRVPMEPKLPLTPDFSQVSRTTARPKTVSNGFHATKSPIANRQSKILRAFTLLELLVVIAVIVLLSALLLPAAAKAKASAQSIACLNNLAQIQRAYTLYAHDNGDSLPLNEMTDSNLVVTSISGWVLGNAKFDTDTTNLRAGLISKYIDSTAVYLCPADKSTVRGHPGLRRQRSYAANGWLNSYGSAYGIETSSRQAIFVKYKLGQIGSISPSSCFGLIEEHDQCIDDGVFFMNGAYGYNFDSNGPANWCELPSDRHNQGCSISFLDGHADHWPWETPKKFRHYMQRATEDLNDLRKLQHALPYD